MPLPEPSPDSTALITGASSGIGSEVARALARRGHGVTLVARREDRLRALADELAAGGVRTETVACDLSSIAGRDELASAISERGLEVGVLVNNAGFGSAGRFIRLERERELRMVALNCEAVVDLSSRYAPAMAARGRGGILNVASTAAFQPLPGQSTYAASKAFVLSFSEALHQELAGAGVSVSVLCPGPVRTEFADVAGMEGIESATPGFLWAAPDTVAEAGVRGLESGERVVIPGAVNAVGAVLGRHSPRSLLLRATARFYPVGRE
jgi:short-subunit dehydrogenase